MDTPRSQPDAKLLAVIAAAVAAVLGHDGFRVISVEQAKREGMG